MDFQNGAIFDPISDQVLVGQGDGNDVFALNPTTGAEIGAIPLPYTGPGAADPEAFAIDPVHDVLWTANLGWGASAINLTTDTFVKEVPAEGPRAITYDSVNRCIYTVGFATSLLTVINTSTDAAVANKTIHGASSITYDPLSNSLYLTDSGSGTILVVNTSTLAVADRITPSIPQFSPWDTIYDPDAGTMIVAGGSNVSIVNATTNRLVASNSSVDVGGGIGGQALAFDPANHEIYVAPAGRTNGTGVAALDSRTGAYLREIWTEWSNPPTLAYASSSDRLFATNGAQLTLINTTDDAVANLSVQLNNHYFGATYDPGNGLLYIANNDPDNGCVAPGTLTLVRPSADPAIVGSLPTGNGPQQVAVDSLHHRIFVTNLCSDTVSVIDDSNNSVVNDSVGVGGGPEGIAINAASGTVYVSDVYDNSLYAIDETTLSAKRLLNFSNYSQPAALAYDPVDQRLFVALYGSNNVSVLNTSSNTLLPTVIPVGAYPQGILYDSSNGRVYVACSGSSNLSVIDAASLRVITSIPTDAGPVSLALDPGAGILYVDAFNAGSVDLVQTSNDSRVSGSIRVATSPLGIAYVPGINQVDVSDEENGTISILANAPQLASVQFIPGTIESRVPVSLSIGVVNGTPPYAASVNSTVGTCSVRLPTFACRFSNPGPAQLRIRVTDSVGYAAWSNLRVNVTPRLTDLALHSSVSALDVGQSVQYSLEWTGGAPPVSLLYFGLPTGCAAPTSPTWTCAPTAAGSYAITVLANDSDGVFASASADLTVYPALQFGGFLPAPTTYFVGQRLQISPTAIGGKSPYGYEYAGLPQGCVNTNESVLTCTPAAPGNFSVHALVTDALGAVANGTETVIIASVAPLRASIVSIPQDPIRGQSMSIAVSVSGGVPPYSFTFAGLPAACPDQNANSLVCGAPTAGSYTVTVDVRDSDGQSSSATASFSVSQACSISGASCGLSPLDVGLIAFVAALAGGAVAFAIVRLPRRGGPPESYSPEASSPGAPIHPSR